MSPGTPTEYKRLKKDRPSYRDAFELLEIEAGVYSEWMMCAGEDLAAHVRRKSDKKEFYLGLSEIETIDKKSPDFQLLDDYAMWFVNYR